MEFCKEKIIAPFKQAVSESLEGMAFLEFDEARQISNLPVFDTSYFYSVINFTEPLDAAFILLGKYDFVKETVESINGDELPEDEISIIFDTLGEIVNTIGGRFLAHITPEDQEFKMGLPDFKQISCADDLPSYNENALIMDFDFMGDSFIAILSCNKD